MRLEHGGSTTLLFISALLGQNVYVIGDHTHPTENGATAVNIPLPTSVEVCESRTINNITHTLPQQCLRTSWASSAASSGPEVSEPTPTSPPSASNTSVQNGTPQESSTEHKPGADVGDEEVGSWVIV